MNQPFFKRLRDYYLKVAEVLRGEADSASVFPNTTDIGSSREKIYQTFLKQHAPQKCNTFLGGFLFDDNGNESKQLDIIIMNDTAPKFDFHNADGSGKSFSPVEGCIGVVSIKSNLDKDQLYDSLSNIASIPPTKSLENRITPLLKIKDYEDWPYKIIYASNGLKKETIIEHLENFYNQNPDIPISRRPHVIHVAGKYVIMRMIKGMSIDDSGSTIKPVEGTYHAFTKDSDLQAIIRILDNLQQNAVVSTHIYYSYRGIINKVNGITNA